MGVGFIQFFVREEEYFDGICIVNIRLCVRERKGGFGNDGNFGTVARMKHAASLRRPRGCAHTPESILGVTWAACDEYRRR